MFMAMTAPSFKKNLKSMIKISLFIPLFFISFSNIAGQLNGLRDSRYCEIIVGESKFRLAVYNTIGLNNCPENVWDKITTKAVKNETKASFVRLNGPRFWVLDGMTNTTLVNPDKKVICGLPLRKAGVLDLTISDIFAGSKPYNQHEVARHTTWVYKAGKPVFELIDPKGKVYVMQSYSIENKPQTIATLSKLGSELKLPQGWQFRSGILKADTELKAINDKAIVIQDNFLNTYELATHDFLNQ